jgi:hypothetical protein
MARISRSDKLKRYQSEIAAAIKHRSDEGFDATWRRLIDLYKGKHFENPSNEDRIAINISFSTVNVIFPSISVNYPKFTVQPNREEDLHRAIIVEATSNYWWRHYDFQEPFRAAAKDYIICGHGWLKIGYSYKEREVEATYEDQQSEFEELVAEADAFAAERPDLAADIPTDDEIAENLAETKAVVVEDQPTVERISPFDMFVDPDATSLQDAMWIAQRIERPIEDVRKDKRYKASARRKVKSTGLVGKGANTSEARAKIRKDEAEHLERCVIWEHYDIRTGFLCVFAADGDEFLIEPQQIPFAYGHPFVMFRNYDVPDQFYPIGDLEQLECLQHELNKTRSQMMNHRKKFARKYLYKARMFGPDGREALESDMDNRFVPVVDEQADLNQAVVPVPQVPLPPEMYSHSEIIEDDIDTVSGVNEYARGGAPNIRRTATEAAIIQDAINARSADKLAQVEMVLSKVARRLVQVMQQYMTGEKIARVNGEEGKFVWVPYERENIQGEFDFVVEAGSTQPTNEMFRRQQALAMGQAMMPMVSMGVVNPYELAKEMLQKGFGVKNPTKFLMPSPMLAPDPLDPNAQAMGGSMPGEEPMVDPSGMPEGAEQQPGLPAEIMTQLAAQGGLSL